MPIQEFEAESSGAPRCGATAPPLAYVAVVVDDPASVAAVFERDLGLPRTEVAAPGGAVPWIAVGASAMALFGHGHEFVTTGSGAPDDRVPRRPAGASELCTGVASATASAGRANGGPVAAASSAAAATSVVAAASVSEDFAAGAASDAEAGTAPGPSDGWSPSPKNSAASSPGASATSAICV